MYQIDATIRELSNGGAGIEKSFFFAEISMFFQPQNKRFPLEAKTSKYENFKNPPKAVDFIFFRKNSDLGYSNAQKTHMRCTGRLLHANPPKSLRETKMVNFYLCFPALTRCSLWEIIFSYQIRRELVKLVLGIYTCLYFTLRFPSLPERGRIPTISY